MQNDNGAIIKQDAQDKEAYKYADAIQSAYEAVTESCKEEISKIKNEVSFAAKIWALDEDDLLKEVLKDGF